MDPIRMVNLMGSEFILGQMEVIMKVLLNKVLKKVKANGKSTLYLIHKQSRNQNRLKIKIHFCIMKGIMSKIKSVVKDNLHGLQVIVIKALTKMMKEMGMER